METRVRTRWLVAVLLVLLAWSAPAAPVGAAGIRPVDGPVVRGFDPPVDPWQRGHRGVDLAASPGTPVRAAAGGRIGFAGEVAGKAVVTVIHGGLRTTYEPVRATLPAGHRVAAGAVIGILEHGQGCGAGGCLHWGLRRGETYLDPMLLLERPRIRLLPGAAVRAITDRQRMLTR